jgi:hypothetical protein
MGKQFDETKMGKLVAAIEKRADDEGVSLKLAVIDGAHPSFYIPERTRMALIVCWFDSQVNNGGFDQWRDNGYAATLHDLEEFLGEVNSATPRNMPILAVRDMLRAIHRTKNEAVIEAFDTCYCALGETFLGDLDELFVATLVEDQRERVAGNEAVQNG